MKVRSAEHVADVLTQHVSAVSWEKLLGVSQLASKISLIRPDMAAF